MSRPRGVSKFKKSAPSIRALWKRAGPSTLKTVYIIYYILYIIYIIYILHIIYFILYIIYYILNIIKGSWEAILPCYGQIEFCDLK